MTVTVTDRSDAFFRAYREAGRKGIDAAAALYEGNVKRRFYKGYYTSGAFRSTAQIVQHVQREEPQYTPDGGWSTSVGIPAGIPVKVKRLGGKASLSVGEIALAWELGHRNTYTRRFERVEIFRPVAVESMQKIAEAFARVFTRYIQGATR